MAGGGSLGNPLSLDILIDNYNYGRFLAEAIESALAQTHLRVKVIVVDDGSTDDSRDILGRYEGRVEIILKNNGGQASALNAAFAASDADLVIFLDADDVLRPEAAALVATAFASDPSATKVQYRLAVIDAAGRPTGVIKPPRHLPLPRGDVRDAETVFPFDLVWLATSANAFRSDALRRIFPIPEVEFADCADWYLVHLTPLLGRVISLDSVAACYRVHGANQYEWEGTTLDLGHVRKTVTYARVTARAIERLADDLGLDRPPGPILSVADLSNRLVSLKLEPELHPLPTDTAWRLAALGARAAARRFDVSPAMKLVYAGWFAVTAASPRPVARRLGELLLFPERRGRLNSVLTGFHHWNRPGAS